MNHNSLPDQANLERIQGPRIVQAALAQGSVHCLKQLDRADTALFRQLVRESDRTFRQWQRMAASFPLPGFGAVPGDTAEAEGK